MLQPPVIQVSDQLERRIRKPADALRCVLACIAIFLIVLAAVAAGATAKGAESNIVGASQRLPPPLLHLAPQIVGLGLVILPVALAIAQLIRR